MWMRSKDGYAHAELIDIDGDAELEVVLRNNDLFGVFSPRWGGRLVALYSVAGDRGAMVVGNPCDDWNWMEEVNRFMDVPRNHPGAFADIGFENDSYECEAIESTAERVHLRLTNCHQGSAAHAMVKEFELTDRASSLFVRYILPPGIETLRFDCGLSPDYLRLLRSGVSDLKRLQTPRMRGWRSSRVAVWLKPVHGLTWDEDVDREDFGHGRLVRLVFFLHCISVLGHFKMGACR
jgi:hypothetical protein